MASVGPGDPFPRLPSLGDVAGHLGKDPLVVYFYPAAGTSGCTREAQDFQAHLDAFQRLGVAVVGVSTDRPATNDRFRERLGLGFPLLSDVDRQAVDALGIASEKGKARRTTFLVDAAGVVQKVWEKVKVDGHAQAVLEAARQLWG
jgi:peroxiredoxin Q/BCP